MAKIYYDKDADPGVLKTRPIAVIGYGSQGHAHALNLRDSGFDVRVGLKDESTSWEKAEKEGLRVLDAGKATKEADVVMVLVPDQLAKNAYEDSIAANLDRGNALAFAHGFNVHFERIVPSPAVDVFMVAPKAPGHLLRRNFESGIGTPSLLAVHQDPTGTAHKTALAYAFGLGSTKAGVIETTFAEETETDLFGEQAVLCGGLTRLITAGFETLVEAGYQPEIAYFECLHEMKLIVDLVYEGGLARMRHSISDTAEYGDLTRGDSVVTDETRKAMKKLLDDVRSGAFAKEWTEEADSGGKRFGELRKKWASHQIEEVGQRLRAMMPWLS
jgi:ketol-acid reductoisomerase